MAEKRPYIQVRLDDSCLQPARRGTRPSGVTADMLDPDVLAVAEKALASGADVKFVDDGRMASSRFVLEAGKVLAAPLE